MHTAWLIVAPSYSGKTSTEADLLADRGLNLQNAITTTTRPPREGERDGVDYFFVSTEHFEEMFRSGELVQREPYQGQHYGLSRNETHGKISQGDILRVVTGQGAIKWFRDRFDTKVIFLEPPGEEESKRRARERGDDESTTVQRLENRPIELELRGLADHVIPPVERSERLARIKQIILDYRKEHGHH